jgi:glycerol-3-phosphate dehydrogenase
LKSEISYASKNEMAMKPGDVICRRIPIAFLNKEAAEQILPEVVEIMGKEHQWSSSTKT